MLVVWTPLRCRRPFCPCFLRLRSVIAIIQGPHVFGFLLVFLLAQLVDIELNVIRVYPLEPDFALLLQLAEGAVQRRVHAEEAVAEDACLVRPVVFHHIGAIQAEGELDPLGEGGRAGEQARQAVGDGFAQTVGEAEGRTLGEYVVGEGDTIARSNGEDFMFAIGVEECPSDSVRRGSEYL